MSTATARLWWRRLALQDWRFCRTLASQDSTREASLDRRPPTLWGHAKWMWRWAGYSPERIAFLLIADPNHGRRYPGGGLKVAPGPLGIVRASKLPRGGCEVGIALLEEARGRGIGSWALRELTPILAHALGGPVFARIRAENYTSQAAFANAGYFPARESDWQRLAGGMPHIVVMAWYRHREAQ